MTTYFKVRCHCGTNDFKVGVDTSKLPIITNMCHCSACRHGSGTMSNHDVLTVGPPVKEAGEGTNNLEPASLDGMFVHERSKRGARYNCKKCFARIFFVEKAEGDLWWLFTGVMEKRVWGDKGGKGRLLDVVEHIFVEPTLDGGFADHWREFGGKKLKRWGDHGNEELKVGWINEGLKLKQEAELENGQQENILPFYCKCKAISFNLIRPSAADAAEDKYLVPGRSPEDPFRFRAFHCLCNSCQLTSGGLVVSRATVPSKYLLNASTSDPIILDNEDQRLQGLVRYESSPGVYRESCGTCGAAVFYWKRGQANECVDVTVGLLDEEVDGARAERWLSWDKVVQHKEDTAVPGLGKILEKGLAATLEKGKKEPRNWFSFSGSS